MKQETKEVLEKETKEIDAEGLDLKVVNQMIKNGLQEDKKISVSNSKHLNGLAAGLRSGNVIIKGPAGDYVGALNAGAALAVEGDVGNYVADNMTSGEIIIKANAGFCAAPYCYGGKVVISGTSGDFSGAMNKGATIIIEKDAGNDVGTYMLAGIIVLLGNAGERLGNFLISGEIFIKGKWKSLGHNTKIENLTSDDIEFLQQLFSVSNIDAKPENFTKIVPETDSPFYSKRD